MVCLINDNRKESSRRQNNPSEFKDRDIACTNVSLKAIFLFLIPGQTLSTFHYTTLDMHVGSNVKSV